MDPDPHVLEVNPAVVAYRIGAVEDGLRNMRGELKEAVGTLGGGLTALQTQLSTYQANSVRPRDFDELTRRVDALSTQEGNRGWQIAAALLASLVSAIFTAIGWLHPFGH